MNFRATHIGINKHLDTHISELTGAKKDALALWALFKDTIPDCDSKLLVDKDAHIDAIRHAIDSTLSLADTNDVVIFSFSGHGTNDGRLVAFDTNYDELENTTIGMEELSDSFRICKARAIVIVLDCCFSGNAPARVLESPISRSVRSPFSYIAGKGRILIAASAENEPAWEQPGTGHGLLTMALIDVLSSGQNESITLTSAIDEVTSITRAEAARIGVEQNPVFINHIEGGLTFPRLKRGQYFLKTFPDFDAPQISGKIDELSVYGISEHVLNQWKVQFPDGLNELQTEAVNKYGVLQGQSALVVAPTSSGKTLVGELAAIRAIAQGEKAVFLLPYRALVNEKYETLTDTYGPLGIRITRCSGDYTDNSGLILSGQYDLAVFTYEMFLNLALSSRSVLSQLGMVALDEGQFITDPNRGITVELILTLLIQGRQRGITPQLLILSAVIGSINSFDNWLGCRCLISSKRPVPLIEGVLDRSGTLEYVDEEGQTHVETFLPHYSIQQRRKKPSAQDIIVPLAKQLIEQNEKMLIFRNQRGSAEGCASYLATDLDLPTVQDALDELPNHDLSSTSRRLRECLTSGTAFHNANLQRNERRVVEKYFRDPAGGIAALGATTTLAAGINTPASTVILAETKFVGEDGREFTIAEYKNMVGRAGRLGYNETGKAILLAESGFERENLFRKYVLGKPEPIESSFKEEDIPTWVIRLLSQTGRVHTDEVITLLLSTFGGFLLAKQNPGWDTRITPKLHSLLTRMIDLGLAEQDGDFLQLTLLGKACGRSSLSFESALRLVELLRQRDLATLKAVDLLALVQVLQESDNIYTPLFKRGQSENKRVMDASTRYGRDISELLQRFAADNHEYWARCKRAAVIWDWIHGTPVETIEQDYSANPYAGRISYGDIIRFTDNTRFHLRSTHQIISVILLEDHRLLEELDILLSQLELGCPMDALPLLELPMPLERGQLLALFNAGFATTEEVLNATTDQLKNILGDAASLLEAARIDSAISTNQ
ncbi:MAG: DEAD/DEAH box helicase [Candidatus Thiodiazotropha sp.]